MPKVCVLFDIGKDGKAEPGTQHKSRLLKIDNLQAAHTYCNKRRATPPRSPSGATPPCRRSRSRAPRTAEPSCCPGRRIEGSISALTPGNRQHFRHSLSVLAASMRWHVSLRTT